MTIYLASAFDQRWWLRTIVPVLEERGWTVVSDWVQLTDGDVAHGNEDFETMWAERNFQQLHNADVFVLFVRGQSQGGCWTELGFALAEGKPCLVVGETKNVFTRLPAVRRLEEDEWLKAVEALGKSLGHESRHSTN